MNTHDSGLTAKEAAAFEKVAIEAATGVADLVLEGFRSALEVDTKKDFHDPVTVYDERAEDAIRDTLLKAFPSSMIVGEESGTTGSSELVWHVDPIDGTANFASGIPFWCVSIGARFGGTDVCGVILDPVRGDVFHAGLAGAYRNGDMIRVRRTPDLRRGMIISSFPTAGNIARFGHRAWDLECRLVDSVRTVRALGSAALNLAFVAAGWADATFGFGINSWDVAAGAHLIRQAGGVYHGYTEGVEESDAVLCPDYWGGGPEPAWEDLAGLVRQTSGSTAEAPAGVA